MSLRLFLLIAYCFAGLAGNAAASSELELVRQLQRDGQTTSALAEAERHLAREPKDAQMRFLRATLLADLGRVTEAIDVLQRLSQDFPSLAEPHNNLAALHASRGEYEKARDSLEQAVRLNPDYATAHENLGDVYAALAAQAYGTVQRLDPARTSIATKLGTVRQLTLPVSVSAPAASAAK